MNKSRQSFSYHPRRPIKEGASRAPDHSTTAKTRRSDVVKPDTLRLRQLTLKTLPAVTPGAARAAVLAVRRRVSPKPGIPVCDTTVPTFAELAERVIPVALTSTRRDPRKPTKPEQRWRNAVYNHAALICSRPIQTITTKDILEVLAPIWTVIPSGSRKTREHIHRVFAYAIANGDYVGPNPARWKDHLDQLLKREPPVSVPHAAIDYKNVRSFLDDLRTHDGIGAAALEFILFTGARTGELRLSTWAEIDLRRRLWLIPRQNTKERRTMEKLGRAHKRIPLSAPAIAILERLRPAQPATDRPIFTVDGVSPISETTMLGVLEAMGLKGVATTHGLRSTFRDWTAEQRFRLPNGRLVPAYSHAAAEISLGHNTASQVERAYHRSDHLEERVDLMTDWANYVTGYVPDIAREPSYY